MRAQMMTLKRIGILIVLTVLGLGTELHAAPSVVCGAAFGAKFNLEPNTHAVPQQLEAVDFIPNRLGPDKDLVVGGSYDIRGGGLGSPPPPGHVLLGSDTCCGPGSEPTGQSDSNPGFSELGGGRASQHGWSGSGRRVRRIREI